MALQKKKSYIKNLECQIVFSRLVVLNSLNNLHQFLNSRPLFFSSMLFGLFNCIYLYILLWKFLYLHPRFQKHD